VCDEKIGHDYFGTMVLPKEVRDEGWVAKFCRRRRKLCLAGLGDGNLGL